MGALAAGRLAELLPKLTFELWAEVVELVDTQR